MGWLYCSAWNDAKAMRDELRKDLSVNHTIVKDALVAYGRHYYAAVKSNKTGDINIFVALLERSKDGWGYKDMDESMGPVIHDCPLSVLDAADPVEKLYTGLSLEWATNWRAAVRAHWAKRAASRSTVKTLKVGDVVNVVRAADNPFTIASLEPLRGYGKGGTLYRLPKNRIAKVEPLAV